MPRKREVSAERHPERAAIAIDKLGAALTRLPAAAWWLAALGSMRELRTLRPGSTEQADAIAWFLVAAHKTALEVCGDPTLQGYFRGPDRVAHVRHWLLACAPALCGVPPAASTKWSTRYPLRVWTPRGPRPGPRKMTQEEFDEIEPSTRAELRGQGLSTAAIEIAEAMGISRATYFRFKAGAN